VGRPKLIIGSPKLIIKKNFIIQGSNFYIIVFKLLKNRVKLRINRSNSIYKFHHQLLIYFFLRALII